MLDATSEQTYSPSETAAILQKLESLVQDESLRTSRRSVAFLRYIVEETLGGRSDELKERTIGIHVFGKPLTYDTNVDHTVRTAASELRRRLTLYYGSASHSDELRILLVPGSYVPQFRFRSERASAPEPPSAILPFPGPAATAAGDGQQPLSPTRTSRRSLWFSLGVALCAVLVGFWSTRPQPSMLEKFWRPLLDSGGPVLIAVGDVPGGPPVSSSDAAVPSLTPANPGPVRLPLADAMTMARVSGVLSSFNKEFQIRTENTRSFADLRQGPVVLIGAFNNAWSLQLTRGLRFSLAMDAAQRVIYIKDRDHPESRQWQWSVEPHPEEKTRSSRTPLHDYALVSRILDSDTGRDVVVIGGLSTYGTQAAGEFIASPQMVSLPHDTALDSGHKIVQIVLGALITEGTPGPPKILAIYVS